MTSAKLAPIALFVFNRPEHTRATIAALSRNELASDSDLIVFSDGPRRNSDVTAVDAVRSVARQARGFRSLEIVERRRNLGLAKGIPNGVSSVLGESRSVIVVEDDIVTSQAFLASLNEALRRYESVSDVWHVNGWFYPVQVEVAEDVFFWRVMHCWGWATWRDRWSHYQAESGRVMRTWDERMKRDFNLEHVGPFWRQIEDHHRGLIETWAVFWYATIFENGGLCVTPKHSLTVNVGHDGSGTFTSSTTMYDTIASADEWSQFPSEVVESESAVEAVTEFYRKHRPSIPRRIVRAGSRALRGFTSGPT